MEAQTITESEREGLLQQLREENTRAVFVWVSRTYERQPQRTDVLRNRLSDREADDFLKAYMEDVGDPLRVADLQRLRANPSLDDQRNPFFFGLAAYGERYLGLDRLIADVLKNKSDVALSLIADVALVSKYSSAGLPLREFEEIARSLKEPTATSLGPPFATVINGHLRIPHVLIAEATLRALARGHDWTADLHLRGVKLLDHLAGLSNRHSGRVLEMVEAVFLTRDTEQALELDEDALAGRFGTERRFSPFILDLRPELGRDILKRLVEMWPDQPHHAVHYARHLLYQRPTDVDLALEIALAAERSELGAADGTVVHVVGMCYRARMNETLRTAKERKESFDRIGEIVRREAQLALDKFGDGISLTPARSEYGHVASIHTVTKLLTQALELSKKPSLAEFLGNPTNRWCVDLLNTAEEHIQVLRRMPRRLSSRAERSLVEWNKVYGRMDVLVRQLRKLTEKCDEPHIRRAYCNAMLGVHERRWRNIPQTELREIVDMLDRNLQSKGYRDSDIRNWLHAYRNLPEFDLQTAIHRMLEWHELQPRSTEPPFYLYLLYFLSWLNTASRRRDYADEFNRWLTVCKANRELGFRSWSFEWLTGAPGHYTATNFGEMDYDPVATLRGRTSTADVERLRDLPRLVGTISEYIGPQQATLDLGQRVFVRFTPLQKIVKDDLGKKAEVLVSFGYDAVTGWDPQLVVDPEHNDSAG